jgi:hypothetical protein
MDKTTTVHILIQENEHITKSTYSECDFFKSRQDLFLYMTVEGIGGG